jgi:hypothetical protein
MIKKLICSLVGVGLATVAYGQGTVNFNTQTLGASAQVYSAPGVLAAGPAFYAQLYSAAGTGASEASLTPAGFQVNFRSSAAAGYVQTTGTSTGAAGTFLVTGNTTVTVTPVSGGPATVQLRAWASTFATYQDAVNANGIRGVSPVLNLASTGLGGGSPAGTPVNLTGLQGFTMVPEPSTYALGSMALGALCFFRRRRS